MCPGLPSVCRGHCLSTLYLRRRRCTLTSLIPAHSASATMPPALARRSAKEEHPACALGSPTPPGASIGLMENYLAPRSMVLLPGARAAYSGSEDAISVYVWAGRSDADVLFWPRWCAHIGSTLPHRFVSKQKRTEYWQNGDSPTTSCTKNDRC